MIINIVIIGLIIAIVLIVASIAMLRVKKLHEVRDNDVSLGDNTAMGKENKLYIGNLHYRIRGRDLYEMFEEFGPIKHVKLVKDHKTGRSKGYGFVSFESKNTAERALNMHGTDLRGRAMVVRVAKDRV